MADEEYAYLEQQMDTAGRPAAPPAAADDEGEHRGKSERKERRRDRSRERSRDKDKDRDRSKERRPDDRHRDRDRDRGGDRRRDDRGGDRERERSSKDYDRSEDRRDGRDRGGGGYRGHGGGGGGGYERRGGGRGGGYGGGYRDYKREQTPPEERAAKEQEKELKEMERATRTLLASNVNLRADEKDICMFFSRAGTVQDVRMIKDRSKKFKGFVYVEMSSSDEVLKGLQLTGQPLLGQPVWVKSSEHERNMQWELEHARAAQLVEQQQQQLAMPTAIGGMPMLTSAMLAGLSGPLVGGIGGLDMSTMDPSTLVALYGAGLMGTAAPPPVAAAPPPGLEQMQVGPPQDLDDMEDNKGGLRLNAAARMSLMNKLASSAGLQQNTSTLPVAPVGGMAAAAAAPASDAGLEQGMLGPASPIPTQYVLLKNMFSPEEEAAQGEGWDLEIAKDVAEESSKYGQVLHCHVDKASRGHVYIKFASVEAASNAQQELNGRWFAAKRIVAEYQFAHAYQQVFGM